METSDYLRNQEILHTFAGCRTVDGLSYISTDDGYWSMGIATRWIGDEDEQTLGQYAWFLTDPQGRMFSSEFADGQDFNERIEAAKAANPALKDTDPSIILGEMSRRCADGMLNALGTEGRGVLDDRLKSLTARMPSGDELVEAFRKMPPDECANLSARLGRVSEVFGDIDRRDAGEVHDRLFPSPKELFMSAQVLGKDVGEKLANGYRTFAESPFGHGSAQMMSGTLGAGLLTAQATQEAFVQLSGPEVQAITRALLMLAERLAVGEKENELRKKLGTLGDKGLSFRDGNAVEPGEPLDDELQKLVDETTQEVDALPPEKKAERWRAFFDAARKGVQEGWNERQVRMLCASMGLGADPSRAANEVAVLMGNDAHVEELINEKLNADLRTEPQTIVQALMAERDAWNKRDAELVKKTGKKPEPAYPYSRKGYPYTMETMGPYVTARVQAIQAKSLLETEDMLERGLDPSMNALKLFVSKEPSGRYWMQSVLNRIPTPDSLQRSNAVLERLEALEKKEKEEKLQQSSQAAENAQSNANSNTASQNPEIPAEGRTPAPTVSDDRGSFFSRARSFARGRTLGL